MLICGINAADRDRVELEDVTDELALFHEPGRQILRRGHHERAVSAGRHREIGEPSARLGQVAIHVPQLVPDHLRLRAIGNDVGVVSGEQLATLRFDLVSTCRARISLPAVT